MGKCIVIIVFFFSSRRRHTILVSDWSSDVCSSDLAPFAVVIFDVIELNAAIMTTNRCAWASVDNPLMLEYHDREWGVPVHNDRKHFEFLVLSGAPAGLNFSVVLKKAGGLSPRIRQIRS